MAVQTTNPNLFQAKVLAYVRPRIIVFFAILGLLLLLGVELNGIETLRQANSVRLLQLSQQIRDTLNAPIQDVQALANSSAVREFAARNTLMNNLSSEESAALQGPMLLAFADLLANNSSDGYLAVRYLTSNGFVFGEVNAYQDAFIATQGADVLSKWSRDLGFERALNATPGQVVAGPPSLLSDDNLQPLTPEQSIVQFYAPVFDELRGNERLGIVQLEVRLDRVFSAIQTATIPRGARLLLIENRNRALVDTEYGSSSYALPANGAPPEADSPANNPEIAGRISSSLADFLRANPANVSLSLEGGNLVSIRRIDVSALNMTWRIVLSDDFVSIMPGTHIGALLVFFVTLVTGFITVRFIDGLLDQALLPLQNANKVAQQMILVTGARQRTGGAIVSGSDDDEIGQLLEAFQRMSSYVREVSNSTRAQMARRMRNLEIAARISRETAKAQDLPALMNSSLSLMCDYLDFYHAQVFLVDDAGVNVILAYSHGEVGQKLMAVKHHFAVGQQSIVGNVAASGKSIFVNDTQSGERGPHAFNPLLPRTRAEMGVPLLVGHRVIGVLDIQSTQVGVFNPEDLPSYELIADQLAIAIHRADLQRNRAQSQAQVDALTRRLTREAWQEAEKKIMLGDYFRYDLMEVRDTPLLKDNNDTTTDVRMNAEIAIRGQTIGKLEVAVPEGQTFTEGDKVVLNAVAERVALAIENARLFQETQSTLLQTSTLYQMGRRLNEANTLEAILDAVIETIVPDAVGGQIWMFDSADSYKADSGQWLEIITDYPTHPRELGDENLTGLRLRADDHLLLREIQNQRVTVVADTLTDQRLDEALRGIFHRMEARSVILMPLTKRGEWSGMLTFGFLQPRRFLEQDIRTFASIADQAGTAIDNRILNQETEEALERNEDLYAASRIINTAQNLPELVYAAVRTSGDPNYDFALVVLEGEPDSSGWPTRARILAEARVGKVQSVNLPHTIFIAENSPLRDREPMIVIDYDPESLDVPPAVQFLRDRGQRFMTVFPLFSGNQPIALFYVMSREERELTQNEYEVYRALTGQMSTVLWNRRLLNQTAEALDQTQRLYEATRAITRAQEFEQVYSAAADNLGNPLVSGDVGGGTAVISTHVSHIVILLAEPQPSPDAPYLRRVYVWGRSPGEQAMITVNTRIEHEQAPLGRMTTMSKGAAYYADLSRDPSARRWLRAALDNYEPSSALIVPLQSRQKWLGALICVSDQAHSFDEQYKRFAQAVGDQVAIAVENKLLFEEAQMEARRAQVEAQRALALAEVGQLATRIGSEFERNISDVVARVSEQAGYDRWLLMLEGEDGLLHRLTWRVPGSKKGTPTGFPETLDIHSSEHSLVDAVRLERSVVVNDPLRYAAFQHYDRQGIQAHIGKHIAQPIIASGAPIGALLIGRAIYSPDMDERDEQFVNTLAAQITIAVENRNLFRAVEGERQQLRAILQTMPAGVLVLDPKTYKPVMFNDRVEALLGRPINVHESFTALEYDLFRTGTELHYPNEELPIYQAMAQDSQINADDVAVIRDDSKTDLLMNAAPIRDAQGELLGIVAAFQDISALRGLENTLQENLRETVSLYETTRALSEAGGLEDVLNVVLEQMSLQASDDAYIVLMEDDLDTLTMARYMVQPIEQLYLLESALDARETVCIDNVQTDARLSDEARVMLRSMGLNALATTPLRTSLRAEVPLGWLIIAYHDARTISDDVQRSLESLRDQASTAVDNRYLIEQTRNTLDETTVLYRATRALAVKEVTTAQDILDIVIENLLADHIDQVFVAMLEGADNWDASNARVEIMASWQASSSGVDLTGISLSAGEFPAWSLLGSSSICTIDDTENHPDLTPMERASIESLSTRSVAILPLRVPKRAIGAIWISANQTHKHTDRELRIFQTFAEQASIALEAARLLQQTDRRARQLLTSARVSEEASRILDLNELLPRLVALIQEQFGYDHVQIFLMDADDNYALLRASTGEIGRQMLAVNHKLQKGSRSVIGQVTATGRYTLVSDTADAQTVHKPNPYLPLTRSELALPMIVKEKVVGALDVQSNQPNAFGEEDIGALTTLAAQISVAIDNAGLYDQAQRRANEMSFMFQVTTSAAASTSLRNALETVAQQLQRELAALSVCLYVPHLMQDRSGSLVTVLQPLAAVGIETPLSEMADVLVGDQANLIGVKAQELKPDIVYNIEEYNQNAPNLYVPAAANARSAIIMPLVSGGKLVGLIAVEDQRANAYNFDTLQLLRTLSSSLSAIVQNAQLLEEIRRANEQLREADRLKSDFLANMSHELRTPLNSIIGFSRVMIKGIDGPLTEMQEQDLNTIYTAGQHLLGLINDILDQAKIAANKLDLKLDYFDMKTLIDGVKSMGLGYAKQYDKPHLSIIADVAPGLPRCYGDEFRTRQVLNNLLSNAIKFTPQGAVTISAYQVKDAQGRIMVQVDVQDSGIGIAEKDIPLLFEAFRQVDSSLTRVAGGTGLGLPISKSLVEMQGGTITVRSQLNVGSVFSITIPTEPAPVEKEKKGTDELKPVSADTPHMGTPIPTSVTSNGGEVAPKRRTNTMPKIVHSRRQVLLIEDNPEMVDQYRRILQREGFEVFNGDNPFMAEAMAGGLRPTLMLMDGSFASGEGWDVLKRLKERDDTFDIPVIIAALADEAEKAHQYGAHRFLRRPFLPEQLLEAVLSAEQEASTERILIIDDQPDTVRLLTHLLDTYGSYRVFSAQNAQEGIGLVARRRPDLIILDLRMPEKDGFAVLQELRSNPETASIPILVVTSEALSAIEQEQLADVQVMSKSDITKEEFERFLKGVRRHLSGENGA
ncbi:MAG: GAF domain-containing protein [Chloroflexi bacterium]|nr:GAF domain-containing protein [Chloroflexota bacterium]